MAASRGAGSIDVAVDVAVVGAASAGVIELDADALLDAAPTAPARSALPLAVAAVDDVLLVADPTAPAGRPRWRERRAARRLQARRVGRIVRHVDAWSVFKVALLLHLCAFVVITMAGVMVWSVAVDVGVVTDVEDVIRSTFALQSFSFDGDRIFRLEVLGGLGLVVVATMLSVLLAVVFNLISDLVGGIRLTVVEEETLRPAASRRR